MSKNILYENVDMLRLMEACEDNSKDFIMLFIPISENAVYTLRFERTLLDDKSKDEDEQEAILMYKNIGEVYTDEIRAAIFDDEDKFKEYCDLISKVIQNASRILCKDGTLCFAVPKNFFLIKNDKRFFPDIKLMLSQRFQSIREMNVPDYCVWEEDMKLNGEVVSQKEPFIHEKGISMTPLGTEYTLYLCGEKVKNWNNSKEETIYAIKREDKAFVRALIAYASQFVGKLNFNVSDNLKKKITPTLDPNLPLLNRILIYELYDNTIRLALTKGPLLVNEYAIDTHDNSTTIEEQQEFIKKRSGEIEKAYSLGRQFQSILNTYLSEYRSECCCFISECLIKTFCKEGDKALFPYDRNGQYAWAATKFGLSWTSNYKIAYSVSDFQSVNGCICDDDTGELKRWHKGKIKYDRPFVNSNDDIRPQNYLHCLEKKDYTTRYSIPSYVARTYDANFLSSADELNEMKAQFAKYSNLIGQVVECASTGGEETYGDVEQAVHAIISLAVRAREGTGIINGDEAEKWFGEGWELLSEQCRNYLQTAAAYEKLSLQNGNADCAPIAIEFCRALELETNSVVMKPYIDYYYAHGFQDKTYKGNFKTIQKFQGAVEKQRNNSKEGMMLGQIGTCMRNAPDSVDDKNIFYSFKKYCEENGKEQLLDVDVVGEFQLVGKIRNQSAHPSLLDKGCVAQAKQLVRTALKTQLAVEAKFAHSTVLTCAVVCSPKGNKIDPNSEKMRKAVANQIEMMAQSGVKIFMLTGKFGFNQIVSDELQKYIKENAGKDWGKIMVNNASDKGEASKRQKDALSKAQFCIAYYADDVSTQENDQAASVSAVKAMVDDAIKEHGLIVWNAYGIE